MPLSPFHLWPRAHSTDGACLPAIIRAMEDDTINFAGPPGETVFYRILRIAVTEQNEISSLNTEMQRHLERMGAQHDDRALALVGGITVENAVFTFLAELLPGHKELERIRFANQIQIARAARLCPTRLFDMADAVRAIRNKFAHDLHIESLNTLQGPPLAALNKLPK